MAWYRPNPDDCPETRAALHLFPDMGKHAFASRKAFRKAVAYRMREMRKDAFDATPKDDNGKAVAAGQFSVARIGKVESNAGKRRFKATLAKEPDTLRKSRLATSPSGKAYAK
jgi:hypothetical protein